MEPRVQLREQYWLYVVYDCGTSNPRLLRINDPFYKLVATAKGGVIIDEAEVMKAAGAEGGLVPLTS